MRNSLSAIVLALSISFVTTQISVNAEEPSPPPKKEGSWDKQPPPKKGPPKYEPKDPPKHEPKPLSFDSKKILVISTCLPGNPGAILSDATIVKIGTESFLHGEVPKHLQGWAQDDGTKVMIPINIITQIVEYKDYKAVNKARGYTN